MSDDRRQSNDVIHPRRPICGSTDYLDTGLRRGLYSALAKAELMSKPILFSTEMVQAILEGRKTQTRRVMNPQDDYAEKFIFNTAIGDTEPRWWPVADEICRGTNDIVGPFVKCPYGKTGDTLWVRETWWGFGHFEETGELTKTGEPETRFVWDEDFESFAYFLDNPQKPNYRPNNDSRNDWHKRPSIFMPRWASRITLKITDVRIERAQQISHDDALAEGVNFDIYNNYGTGSVFVDAFAELWDKINSKRGYSWKSNPWVWVIKFEVPE